MIYNGYHDFYDVSRTGAERTLRADYWLEPATRDSMDVPGTSEQVTIRRVVFKGRDITNFLKADTLEIMETEIKDNL